MIQYDLHTHSTASDGIFSPENLVRKAKRQKIKALSLTDHDTVDGLSVFLKRTRQAKILGLSGIEISADLNGLGLHIVGYGINFRDKNLRKILKNQIRHRQERAKNYVQKFRKLGFKIKLADVLKFSSGEAVAKPHVARAILAQPFNRKLLKKKYKFDPKTDLINRFMDTFLKKGQIGFVPKKKISAVLAIKLIKTSNGLAILAHPQKDLKTKSEAKKVIPNLKNYGLDGVEIYNAFAEKDDLKFYHQLCRKYHLLETFGSDFHGLGNFRQIGKIKYLTNQKAKKLVEGLVNLIRAEPW